MIFRKEVLEKFLDKVVEQVVNSEVQIAFYQTLDPKEIVLTKLEDNIRKDYTAQMMINKEIKSLENNEVMLKILKEKIEKENEL